MPSAQQARLLRAWCLALKEGDAAAAAELLRADPPRTGSRPPEELGLGARPLPEWPLAVVLEELTVGGAPALPEGGEAAGRARVKALVRAGRLVARSGVEGAPGTRTWVQRAGWPQPQAAPEGAELVSLPPPGPEAEARERGLQARWAAWLVWRAASERLAAQAA